MIHDSAKAISRKARLFFLAISSYTLSAVRSLRGYHDN
jgi:hypothetical protein